MTRSKTNSLKFRRDLEKVGLVKDVKLFQKDERQDGVRSETGVIGRESFPQTE